MTPSEFKNRYFPELKEITYLASCSLSARSIFLDTAMKKMLADMSSHTLGWHHFEKQVELYRKKIAMLIGADHEQIAIMPSATIGAYQVASTRDWGVEGSVVFPENEFPSIAHVWYAQEQAGVKCKHINTTNNSNDNIYQQYQKFITEKTKLISVPYVAYLDGRRMPANKIIKLAKSTNTTSFVDAYQAIGTEAINVKTLDCDYLVAGNMKYLFGLPGVAFLYVKSGVNKGYQPTLTGLFGRRNPFEFDAFNLDYSETARCFEISTPSIPAIYAANAGLSIYLNLDINLIKKHIFELKKKAIDLLKKNKSVLVLNQGIENYGAHISVKVDQPLFLSNFLEENSIIVSPRKNLIRLSFHYFNTLNEIETTCQFINEALKGKLKKIYHREKKEGKNNV